MQQQLSIAVKGVNGLKNEISWQMTLTWRPCWKHPIERPPTLDTSTSSLATIGTLQEGMAGKRWLPPLPHV
ncbi:hypothetical protein V5799_017126 [Amblyomma americanum]|uniref:Uncharacterized protein n=1 Tax=Amblyomma americanum TaxID=6943 RepID=A0AAQ4F404_AMBAM